MAEDKLKANEELEKAAAAYQGQDLHPIVSRIQHKFGLLNVLRNQRNEKIVKAEKATNLEDL